ncbi:MAG: PD-(D/E)XK motif protein [Solirubrobacterales bacterium]|nr:PD-(D/E)XK motif protein [Solirubrobacterales bacterium]
MDMPSGTKQVTVSIERRPEATALVFGLSEDGSKELFAAMAADVAASAASCDDPSRATEAWCGRYAKWRRMFEGSGRGLSVKRQMGLCSELLTLVEDLVPIVGFDSAVNAWIGPNGNPRDFEISGFGLEVKASGANEPQVVPISNERQLDDSELSGLVLLHRSFDIVRGGTQTLPEVVSRIRSLGDGMSAEGGLHDKLLASGYADENAELYRTTAFETKRTRMFDVRDGFPRITETQLLDGVGSVSYRLAIDACGDFEFPVAEWGPTLRNHLGI